ncbi:hypothetical protein GCM10009731_05670 [Streptomyces globosus]
MGHPGARGRGQGDSRPGRRQNRSDCTPIPSRIHALHLTPRFQNSEPIPSALEALGGMDLMTLKVCSFSDRPINRFWIIVPQVTGESQIHLKWRPDPSRPVSSTPQVVSQWRNRKRIDISPQ